MSITAPKPFKTISAQAHLGHFLVYCLTELPTPDAHGNNYRHAYYIRELHSPSLRRLWRLAFHVTFSYQGYETYTSHPLQLPGVKISRLSPTKELYNVK